MQLPHPSNTSSKMIRTQISLTPELKKQIHSVIKKTGQSMSDFFRQAAINQLEKKITEKLKLRDLAENFVNSGQGGIDGAWSTKEKIDKWCRDIRDEWED